MLQRIFIKNYKNVNDPKVRSQYGFLAGIFGIITNMFLCTIKVIIGLASSSVTIMADAFNNLSDCMSSIITLVGFALSKRKADEEHPFGHARYEYLTGTIIAYFIFLMGVVFAKESIDKIIHPEILNLSTITYFVLIVAVIIKLLQMFVYLDLAHDSKSPTIKAMAYDSRNDAISTSVVLISMLVIGVLKVNIDGLMGLVVSIFIIISSIKLIKETIDPLLGQKATPEQVKFITDELLKNKDIKGIHNLIIHSYGASQLFATVHAEVDDSMSIIKAHDIMDSIERRFKEKYNIFLTIHADPVNSNDEFTKEINNKVKEILKEFDDSLTVQALRVVSSDSHINVIFGIKEPFEKEYTKQEIRKVLNNKFKNEDKKYYFIFNINRPYC